MTEADWGHIKRRWNFQSILSVHRFNHIWSLSYHWNFQLYESINLPFIFLFFFLTLMDSVFNAVLCGHIILFLKKLFFLLIYFPEAWDVYLDSLFRNATRYWSSCFSLSFLTVLVLFIWRFSCKVLMKILGNLFLV